MRALVFNGVEEIAYTSDRPDPEILEEDDAVVTLEGSGLCGSDLHPYLGREPARTGVVPGHEGVGVVSLVGPSAGDLSVGDRVIIPFSTSCGTCDRCRSGLSSRCRFSRLLGWGDPSDANSSLDGTQATEVRVPMANTTLVRAPTTMSVAQGLLLADNLPTGWYAATRAEIGPGSHVAVLGAGSVGLCAVVAALHLEAESVVAVDPVEERRKAAEQLGARAATPAVIEGESGRFGSIVDAAGTASSQTLAGRLASPGATISMIAVQTVRTLGITPQDLYGRNLTVRSGRAPVRSLIDHLIGLVSAGELEIPDGVVFTDTALPLSEGPETYRRFADRSHGIIKAWFDPTR